MQEKRFLTRQEYERLKKEIQYLETQKRKEVAEALKHAAGFGDLSENAAFEDAKAEQRMLETRIAELKEFLNSVKIIEKEKGRKSVQLGSVVILKSEDEIFKFKIVGVVDSNVLEGRISCESPLGKVLLGKEEGTQVSVETPEGKRKYQILKIE